MIKTNQHTLTLQCNCAHCNALWWERVEAEYTMPSEQSCISAMKIAGWVFEGDKHYAPGHLEKYGRHVSKWEKQQ